MRLIALLVNYILFAIVTGCEYTETWTEDTSVGEGKKWAGVTMSADGTKMAATERSDSGSIWTSTDSGVTWTEDTTVGEKKDWNGITSSDDGTKLAATVIGGNLWTSSDSGATWTEDTSVGSTKSWFHIDMSADGTNAAASAGKDVYTSDDSGTTWGLSKTFSGNLGGIAMSSDGTKLAVTVGSGNIWTSSDSGVTWTEDTSVGDTKSWKGIVMSADGTKMATMVQNSNIYISSDSGATWSSVSATSNWNAIAMSADGTKISVTSYNDNAGQTSLDGGATWTSDTQETKNMKIAYSSDGTKMLGAPYNANFYIKDSTFCDPSQTTQAPTTQAPTTQAPTTPAGPCNECSCVDANGHVETNSLPNNAFKSCYALTSATILDGVTSIGEYAFMLTGLTSVSIPDSVTSIGRNAFYDNGLTSIVIPDSVTTMGENAFSTCRSLTSANIPNSLTEIKNGLFEKTGISTITIPNTVTAIGAEAFGDTSLTSIVIPNSVTSIGYGAFEDCTSMTSAVLPTGSFWNLQSDTFRGCTSLTSVDLGQSVTTIGTNAFLWCESLTSIVIPDGLTVLSSGSFLNAPIASITLPDTITTFHQNAFGINEVDAGSLSQVCGIDTTDFPDVYLMKFLDQSAQTQCTSPDCPDGTGGVKWCAGGQAPTTQAPTTPVGPCNECSCVDANGHAETDSLPDEAFQYCSELTSVTILNGVTSIGEYTFNGCTSLTSVSIPDSVTSIGKGAFYGNTGLTSIVIPDSVTTMGNSAFSHCTSLTSFNLPSSLAEIKAGLFENCPISTISIPNTVTYIGADAFQGTQLTTIDIPNSVQGLGRAVFKYCTSLTSAILPTHEYFWNLQDSTFEGCTSLTSVDLGQSITKISTAVFEGCTSLTSIVIPDGVTEIRGAFQNSGITSITLPDTITSFTNYAFGYNEVDAGILTQVCGIDTSDFPDVNLMNSLDQSAQTQCTSPDCPDGTGGVKWCAGGQAPTTQAPTTQAPTTQTWDLEVGWNWVAMSVELDDMTMASVLNDPVFQNGDVVQIQGEGAITYYDGTGWWAAGGVPDLSVGVGMKIKVSADKQIQFTGTIKESITYSLNTGWTWISIPISDPLPINDFLTGTWVQDGVQWDRFLLQGNLGDADFYTASGWDSVSGLTEFLPGQTVKVYKLTGGDFTFTPTT